MLINTIKKSKEKIQSPIQKILENEFDYDFKINEKSIHSKEQFVEEIIEPSKNGERIFYRGERINEQFRHLTPTLLREDKYIFENELESIKIVDADKVMDIYSKMGNFQKLYYEIDQTNKNSVNIYNQTAFAQHYLDVSPFIDFTRSPFVALSFALKGREFFDDDIVIYTVKIRDDKNYTEDIDIANQWLTDYNVTVSRIIERRTEKTISDLMKIKKEDIRQVIEQLEKIKLNKSPTAKLINVPTNDLMKYQQGVFLYLTDFNIFYNTYLTKNIRENFDIHKWVIDKEICNELKEYLNQEKPFYNYEYLKDMTKLFKNCKNSFEI